MAETFTPTTISTFVNDTTAVNQVNGNFTAIQTAFTDVLSRSGVTPNQMGSNLDMNSNQIINLPAPQSANSPARLVDLSSTGTVNITNTTYQLTGDVTTPSGSGTQVSTISANAVTNSKLAQMPAFTVKGNNTASTANPTDITLGTLEQALQFTQVGTGAVTRTLDSKIKGDVYISVVDFGADPTGVADSTSAIQAAINSLPLSGGIIAFPSGSYKISSTITIGNGTGSNPSTRNGIVLYGEGAPPGLTGLTPLYVGTVQIVYSGSANIGAMIQVNGPITGWGIQNIVLNMALTTSTTTNGISVICASYGDVRNFEVLGAPGIGILEFINSGQPSAEQNTWRNITVFLPATSVNAIGIQIVGNSTTGDSFAEYWEAVNIIPNVNTQIALHIGAADTITFNRMQISPTSPGGCGVVFDYTINGSFPGSCVFIGVDWGNCFFSNSGSPNSIARPNYIIGHSETNGLLNPNLSNIYPALPTVINPRIAIFGQTSSIGSTNINPVTLWAAGIYRVNWYMPVQTVGSGGTVTFNLSWTDTVSVGRTFSSSALSLSSIGFLSGSTVVAVNPNTNIAYSTTVTSPTGSPSYALNLVMEKLA